ncbi:MAG: YifB family Mg chelatase-like AAA ATPase, partial [Chloroflexota bacterium]
RIWQGHVDDHFFIGELSLDGTLRPVKGVILMAALARDLGIKGIFVPRKNAREAALIPEVAVYPVETLSQLVGHLTGMSPIPVYSEDLDAVFNLDPIVAADFADIVGQQNVKRALEIAAAGSHNCLLTGPPGTGKTLLSKSLPGILPRMTVNEALEVTKIYSVAGMLPAERPLIQTRPFRSPHHTVSYAGLVGGGAWPRPGEVSLAHRGVLFLDELPEFGTRLIEVLRQPLEGLPREVSISRASGTITFPAGFMLIAAQNPCPCGYHGDPKHACTCSNNMITRYRKRISGPLMDRIDIHVDVPRVDFEKLSSGQREEPSATIRERVEAARAIQLGRLCKTGMTANAEMGPGEVRAFCALDREGTSLLKNAMTQLNLSARSFHRILKLARTIADLAQTEQITTMHLAEALQYRPRKMD